MPRPESRDNRRRGAGGDRPGGGRGGARTERRRGGRSGGAGERPAEIAIPVARGAVGFDAHAELLQAVSRTFFLSVRGLPESIREGVALGYLVARATDTIADSAGGPVEERREALVGYLNLYKYGWDPAVAKRLMSGVVAGVQDADERRLLEETEALVAWYGTLPVFERRELIRVWSRIARAQELDLVVFGEGERGVHALADAAALEEYTYLIAGCVGEFWTRLCHERVPDFSREPLERMEGRGRLFGKALQMINILRDYGKDLAAGRCYFPETELRERGVGLDGLQGNPGLAVPVLDAWRKRAWEWLGEGAVYVEKVDNQAVRLATALPVAIGSRTLRMLEEPGAAVSGGAKLDRGSIKRLVVWGMLAVRFRPLLRGFLGIARG